MGRNKKASSSNFPWKEFLGFSGVVLAAYLGYLGIRTQTEIPIAATQTAEANTTPVQQSPTYTYVPETLGALDTTVSPTQDPAHWQSRFLVSEYWRDCTAPVILPEYINPEQSAQNAVELIAQALHNGEAGYWQLSPVHQHDEQTDFGIFHSTFEISSNVNNTAWIKIEKTQRVSIQAQDDIATHRNIITLPHQCGGPGTIRKLPIVQLDTQHISYQAETTLPELDYISLQPGEFEIFDFEFVCDSPGLYGVQIEIPYGYLGELDRISLSSPVKFVCPQSFTWWSTIYDPGNFDITAITRMGIYVWDGSGYTLED